MPYSTGYHSSGWVTDKTGWRTLIEINLPSKPGNERRAMELVAEAVQGLPITPDQIDRLKTAVAEATMNAMEHGNQYRAELPVSIRVLSSRNELKVIIVDQGGSTPIPETKEPDLEAKLAGQQSPRGWGLFLIKNMVDEMYIYNDENYHTMELVLQLKVRSQDDQ